jgi:hypothetical protein
VPSSEVRRFAAEGRRGEANLGLFYETVAFPLIRHNLILGRRLRTPEYEQLIELVCEAGVKEAHPKLILGGYQPC